MESEICLELSDDLVETHRLRDAALWMSMWAPIIAASLQKFRDMHVVE
jgi:hypothetical protein